MLIIASIIKLAESLYPSSVDWFCPALNCISSNPERIKNGIIPKATKEVLQSKTKAMTIPVTRLEMFWSIMPMAVVVRALTWLH